MVCLLGYLLGPCTGGVEFEWLSRAWISVGLDEGSKVDDSADCVTVVVVDETVGTSGLG